MNALPHILQGTGLCAENIGVLLMANGYTRGVDDAGTLGLLVRALWRSKVVREASRMRRLTRENEVVVLQGLALIGLGFVLQMVGLVVALLGALLAAEPP